MKWWESNTVGARESDTCAEGINERKEDAKEKLFPVERENFTLVIINQ
jgi:hypothetical protein